MNKVDEARQLEEDHQDSLLMDTSDILKSIKQGDHRLCKATTAEGRDIEMMMTCTKIDRINKKIWLRNKELDALIKLELR